MAKQMELACCGDPSAVSESWRWTDELSFVYFDVGQFQGLNLKRHFRHSIEWPDCEQNPNPGGVIVKN